MIRRELDSILGICGLPPAPLYVRYDIPNAVASAQGTAFNPNWLRRALAELDADFSAGQILALMGVSPDDFARLLEYFGALGSETHPPADQRVAALCEGYRSARS